jgi:GNAT superfamily N-acetyltransferase
MIRKLYSEDAQAIFDIVNQAARAYKGHIPDDCYHEPYMPKVEVLQELKNMTFFGWQPENVLMGVMAIQPVRDVTLIRHAYVLPGNQRAGVGQSLLAYLMQITKTERLLVGTWADAVWAIDFYQKHGFKLVPNKDELLRRYWEIPKRQIETSVVLGIEK